MKYKEVFNISNKAYLYALNMLEKCMLPSIWSKNGKGWHEQWRNSPSCGAYASCQGIILLNQNHIDNSKLSAINTAVYDENLFLLFDESFLIKNDDMQFKKMLQRGKALESVYKISFFLYASRAIDVNNNVTDKLSTRLLSLCDFDGYFYSSQSKTHKSFLATAISYNALCNFRGEVSYELLATQSIFVDVIKNYKNYDISKIILALWAISDTIPEDLTERVVENAIGHVFSSIKTLNPILEEKYVLGNGIRDGFSIDVHLVFYYAVLLLIEKNRISLYDNLNIVVNRVHNIALNISENKIYTLDNKPEQALFWRNFFALQCLKKFCDILNKYPHIKEKEYMIIDPKYFTKKDFIVEPKTATIIMPFSVEWSDAVYDAFCQALPEFRIWRSKEECSDDAIMQNVWEHINSSELIIADCTGKNSNVFYELGIAHTIGKRVFMCAQRVEDLPFDINYLRSFLYDFSKEGLIKLKHDLQIFAKQIRSENA